MSKLKAEKLIVPEIDPNKDPSQYTETEKLFLGKLYNPFCEDQTNARNCTRTIVKKFNKTDPCEDSESLNILKELLGTAGENLFITPPFYCDYGSNIHLGKNVYMNFNCVFLDVNEIRVGDNTLFGPNVHAYTASHPTDPDLRRTGFETARPIKIGKDCWIGGGAIILAGVTIGDGVTIGAGSVVTKDIESYTVAVGNPAKVIKKLNKPTESPN